VLVHKAARLRAHPPSASHCASALICSALPPEDLEFPTQCQFSPVMVCHLICCSS
jgi:hypothetical protein